jgi:hypothetical protein
MSNAESRIINWFYCEPGYLPLIRRLLGLLLLWIAPIVYACSHGGSGPYTVPTWRWDQTLLVPPIFDPLIDGALWILYGVCALMMMALPKGRMPVAICTILLAYFTSIDLLAANCTFVLLAFLYLIALLFDTGERGPARRVIEVAVSSCYLYGILQKLLSPEWLSGESLKAVHATAFGVREFLTSTISSIHLSDPIWAAASWAVLAVELFIALALWSKRLRIYAIIIGLSFHFVLGVVFNYVEAFGLAMLIGYLAFVDKKDDLAAERIHSNGKLQPVLAAACMLFMVVMPARIYFWEGRPLQSLSFFDRSPWGFAMYLFVQKVRMVSAQYQTADGQWHELPIAGRMREASSDNDLFAMQRFILKEYPAAREIRIITDVSVNNARILRKELLSSRERTIQVTPLAATLPDVVEQVPVVITRGHNEGLSDSVERRPD